MQNQLRRSCFLIGFFMAAGSGTSAAQNPQREVIARIAPGSVVMSLGPVPCSPGQLDWCSPEIFSALYMGHRSRRARLLKLSSGRYLGDRRENRLP